MTRTTLRSTTLGRLAILLVVLLPGAWACGDSADPPGIVQRIELDPTEATLTFAGQVVSVLAVIYDTNGNTVGRSPQWSSSTPAVATVDGTGTVTAVREGTATITASLDGVSAAMTVTVDQQAASVTVTPAAGTVAIGGSLSMTALVLDGGDNPIPGAAVEWTTSNPGVASVSSSGVVTGVSTGSATITATSDGVSGTAAVTVTGG